MSTVLITGATGFLGRALSSHLVAQGINVRGTLLQSDSPFMLVSGVEPAVIEPLGADNNWSKVLKSVETVFHLAARVHVVCETARNPLAEFRRTNTDGTLNLARQAEDAGVKRFVFMSTIGVNGDNSGDRVYNADDIPQPHNPYSVSKYEAELGLNKLALAAEMKFVVVRAPLVYGPENPANFFALLNIISKGIPLPLASICNKRSFIYVSNLVDALEVCATHPKAAGQLFLISDGDDVSTPELIRRTASALGIPNRLFPFPVTLMRLAGKLIGKSGAVNSLTGSLTVDSSKIREELGWSPPFSMDYALKETAEWFARQVKE